MWIGVDDTDGPEGGCTTFVLTEILRVARRSGIDLLGEPRLVRLNPNVPWKTRGNAALAARFGRGVGPRRKIGALPEGPIWSYRSGTPLAGRERARFVRLAWKTVLRFSQRGPRVDPAMVVTSRPLPSSLYRKAVRSVVPVGEAVALLRRAGAIVRIRGSARGLVGAAAATAWPARRVTWELVAYRPGSRIGTPRRIDPESVRIAEERHPELFQCSDPRTRRLLVAPHTACPILLGVRATDPAVLPRAFREIRAEPSERWVIFRTNQATGDHLGRKAVKALGPYEAGRVEGAVVGLPVGLPGGHVRFELATGSSKNLVCVAFEPTKTLPSVARALRGGDRVQVWGGRGKDPTIRLEGIRVRSAPARLAGRVPPRCPSCGRTAGSMGQGRGFRCPRCRRRFPLESAGARPISERIRLGSYHPTPSARRHLHPLVEAERLQPATPK